MLNEDVVVEMLLKLREAWKEHPQAGYDIIELLADLLCDEVKPEDIQGTAGTILEILEPTRLGKVVWLPGACDECGMRHEPGENSQCWK